MKNLRSEVCGIKLRDCSCGGHPIEAGPSEIQFVILCDNCGKHTWGHWSLKDACRAWNKMAKRETFFYCLTCCDTKTDTLRYIPTRYASNESLNRRFVHRMEITCKLHCLFLNMMRKIRGKDAH